MKKVPYGIDNFKEMIDNNYYYVDKTLFIKDIQNEKVVLYTRPRRFGKTLNMSMLNYFYNVKHKENAYLFDGLEISKDEEVIQHQNKYPVISITLKEMKQSSFQEQINDFKEIIGKVLREYKEVLHSSYLDEIEKEKLYDYYKGEINEAQLGRSLLFISECLEKHYKEKVIILIDEYDVPLQHAYLQGYYDEMVDFLKNVFSSALKGNEALEKGVMTGCLRIAKESIFTGLNNFNVNSIFSNKSSTRFGFTEEEVHTMLHTYGFYNHMEEVKQWYDGYLFGKQEIYNPWSTNMYVKALLDDDTEKGASFWANTSGNDIVMKYISQGYDEMRKDFDELIHNNYIVKKIKPELTYREMDDINNIYSFLLFTGYLKVGKKITTNTYELKIPNEEVRIVYMDQFQEYFETYQNTYKNELMKALEEGKTEEVDSILNDILRKSISYFDNKESFYHGFLVGMFQGSSGYKIVSNKESGEGRFDVVLLPYNINKKAVVIECKHVNAPKVLREAAKQGATQIQNKKYQEFIENEGYESYIGYGIAFCKKQCFVVESIKE